MSLGCEIWTSFYLGDVKRHAIHHRAVQTMVGPTPRCRCRSRWRAAPKLRDLKSTARTQLVGPTPFLKNCKKTASLSWHMASKRYRHVRSRSRSARRAARSRGMRRPPTPTPLRRHVTEAPPKQKNIKGKRTVGPTILAVSCWSFDSYYRFSSLKSGGGRN